MFVLDLGSVFCCDLEPTVGQLAVSGGEDDHAYVWNTLNGEVVFECKGKIKENVHRCFKFKMF